MDNSNEETNDLQKMIKLVSIAATFGAFALSLWVWGHLSADAQVAIHFRLDGSADTYVDKLRGLLITPLLVLGMLTLQILDSALDRNRYLTLSATIILLTAVHFLIAFKALNNGINVANSAGLLLGAYSLGLVFIHVCSAGLGQTHINQRE